MREYFSNPTDRDRSTIQAAQKTLQASLFTLQERLFGVLNAIVRSGPVGRETVLDLLARIVEANKRRAGSRVPRETVSSDGFMANVFAVVLRFAEPFMDVAFSKLSKVDPDYFLRSKRIDLGDVTRLRATQAEADEYAGAYPSASAAGSPAPPNFISEVYWLACALMHVGLGKTVGTRNELERKIGDIERDIKRLEADESWKTGGDAVRQQGEALMKKLKVGPERRAIIYLR
jgi:ubiquitin conjugation factor E4 B